MLTDKFFGSYERFSTPSKKEAAVLLGADNLVGDRYDIVFKTENHVSIAWLKNRFDGEVGFFNANVSRTLRVLSARGWKLNAVLSFIAYSDIPEPGEYWGEMALICYDPSLEESFLPFVSKFGNDMVDGNRRSLLLNDHELQSIIDSNGNWLPSTKTKLPTLDKGTAFIKTRRSFTEKMVEHGRKGNIGCYLISWAFILCLIAFVAFILHSFGLF
ncbi:hypothetical protein [Adlercreutzia sp. ZJ141]|uniref:hypothetical protein n=1 Tax=Adlercreutzia sp. ZJ141 TaxID=2709406 RepID=UPI0013EB114D|nr:hypothetical protein [Adlercreutzia sp. ZJ141]